MTVPYVKSSATSKEAAASMVDHLSRLERRVFKLLRRAGSHGLTCDEIEAESLLKHQTASARIRGLRLKGFVRKTDRTRRTRSGRRASVYVVRKTIKPLVRHVCQTCGR